MGVATTNSVPAAPAHGGKATGCIVPLGGRAHRGRSGRERSPAPPTACHGLARNRSRISSTTTSAYLHELRPTAATFDGVHAHDDLLEDFSRAVDRPPVARPGRLRAPARHRSAARRSRADERLDRAMLEANVQARLHELERHPHLGAQPAALRRHAGDEPRLPGRVRLRAGRRAGAAPRVEAAAGAGAPRRGPRQREGPAGIFVKTAVETLRGAASPSSTSICRARCADVDDLSVLGDLADASTEASQAIGGYVDHLEKEVGPKAKASFRLGQRALRAQAAARRRRHAAGRPRSWRSPSASCRATQEEFRASRRRRQAGGARRGRGARSRPSIRRRASSWPKRARRSRSSTPSSQTQASSRCPTTTPLASRRRRRSIAGRSRACGARVRSRRAPVARLLLPHRRRSVLAARSGRASTCAISTTPTLWSISMHEAYPGHFLHFQHLRRGRAHAAQEPGDRADVGGRGLGALRRARDGRAGLRRTRAGRRLGQLAESLVRLGAARRRASGCTPRTGASSRASASSATRRSSKSRVRGARPSEARSTRVTGRMPSAKLMLAEAAGRLLAGAGRPLLAAAFHDDVLGWAGCAVHLQRAALLGDGGRAGARLTHLADNASAAPRPKHAALRVRVRSRRAPVRGDPEVLRSAVDDLPELRRAGAQAAVVAGDSVQGLRLVHHRLRPQEERATRKARQGSGASSTASSDRRRRNRASRRRSRASQLEAGDRQLVKPSSTDAVEDRPDVFVRAPASA